MPERCVICGDPIPSPPDPYTLSSPYFFCGNGCASEFEAVRTIKLIPGTDALHRVRSATATCPHCHWMFHWTVSSEVEWDMAKPCLEDQLWRHFEKCR